MNESRDRARKRARASAPTFHRLHLACLGLAGLMACDPSRAETPPGPAIAAADDWCAGHGLPESKCTKCNPELIASFQAAGDWCEEHGFPESACPLCGSAPASTPPAEEPVAIEGRSIVFRSAEIERATGIEVLPAEAVRSAERVSCTASIEFDQDRVADVRATVTGVVRSIAVELGQRVDRGDRLFELESVRVGELQAELVAASEQLRVAKANLERLRSLLAVDATSRRDVEVAEQELASASAAKSAAKASLRTAGTSRGSRGTFVIESPIAGVVVERPAVIGTLAGESASLATIADPSVMWALCDVPERDAARVRLGQAITVTVEGSEGSAYTGELSWISATVDPATRTVRARARLANDDGRLRAHQFARASIETTSAAMLVAVDPRSIQRIGEDFVVFVRVAAGKYVPRRVTPLPGPHSDERVPVRGDLAAGEAVVVTGAFLLKTELIPGSIGAGCCEVETKG